MNTESKTKTKKARRVEALDRGLVAVRTDSGVLVSWRSLGTESNSTVYELYRDGKPIYRSGEGMATCYLDADGNAASVYKVITDGKDTSEEATAHPDNYFDIPLNKPSDGRTPDGKHYTYTPGNCSCSDLDGDGKYEIIVKWDPSNAHDNAHAGYSGNVILDAYRLNGEQLWRIDLGVNIRAGAHYTQFLVYDFDGDGKAELVCKTSDGTVDGAGAVIGDADADYRNNAGYVLTGNEYLTVFDGETGAAITTVDYYPPRGNVSDWGDGYGNRVDRFLACVAYLNGETPSIVMCRGYYTRTVLAAYDFDGKKLINRWVFDSDKPENASYAGQGNHNLVVADVDGDGCDEIVYGQCCIDSDGTGLWNTRLFHGDAIHVGDFLPERPGPEVWGCLESGSTGAYLADAATGEILGHYDCDRDVGRALAENFITGNSSAEFLCATTPTVFYYDTEKSKLSEMKDVIWTGGVNFAVWFTGELERCALDKTSVLSYRDGTAREVLRGKDVTSINGSKATPCLTLDLLGDWREEIVFASSDGNFLRVYLTDCDTDYRIYTLMHNTMYRCGVANENICYNIPPHTDYFLDSAYPLPEYPNVYVK
ncbi:MAG: rhamnogalacturonan lyase [Clostridiales bacterium]|nr:rhamnogalacturonan lyase [Clostridiales bacterium]